MEVYAHEVDMRQGNGLFDDGLYLFEVNTEFILGQACGDVAVCVCTYIGVDAKGDACHLVLLCRQFVDDE